MFFQHSIFGEIFGHSLKKVVSRMNSSYNVSSSNLRNLVFRQNFNRTSMIFPNFVERLRTQWLIYGVFSCEKMLACLLSDLNLSVPKNNTNTLCTHLSYVYKNRTACKKIYLIHTLATRMADLLDWRDASFPSDKLYQKKKL